MLPLVRFSSWSRTLVRRTDNLDHRDDILAAVKIENLDIRFVDFKALDIGHQRLVNFSNRGPAAQLWIARYP